MRCHSLVTKAPPVESKVEAMRGIFIVESGVRPSSLERWSLWQSINLTLSKDFPGYTRWVRSYITEYPPSTATTAPVT